MTSRLRRASARPSAEYAAAARRAAATRAVAAARSLAASSRRRRGVGFGGEHVGTIPWRLRRRFHAALRHDERLERQAQRELGARGPAEPASQRFERDRDPPRRELPRALHPVKFDQRDVAFKPWRSAFVRAAAQKVERA